MNGTELFNKASEAAYNYKSVYGKFPYKIGIHVSQLGLLPPNIRFPIMPQLNFMAVTELENIQSHMPMQHITIISPCVGSDIHIDEVYLPIPGDIDKCVSGTFVAKLAKEFE